MNSVIDKIRTNMLILYAILVLLEFVMGQKVIDPIHECPANVSCIPSELITLTKKNRVKMMRMHNNIRSKVIYGIDLIYDVWI